MAFYAVNHQLVFAPSKEAAIELYYSSRRDDLERLYMEHFEW